MKMTVFPTDRFRHGSSLYTGGAAASASSVSAAETFTTDDDVGQADD